MIERGCAVGRCPKCGRIITRLRPADSAVCECWKRCPSCGGEMTAHTPDSSLETYARDSKREMLILMVCNRHNPPFLSVTCPVEVPLA